MHLSSTINYVYERSRFMYRQRRRLAPPCVYGVLTVCSRAFRRLLFNLHFDARRMEMHFILSY